MVVWRDYLRMLKEDGVQVVESEEEAVTEDGERIIACTLIRQVEGRLLSYVVPVEVSMAERVPRLVKRQAPVALRLPPEKYIFPDL